MPLPMVHCAIAVQLGERLDRPPSAAFLLGSIAPDAIHMRPNAQQDDKRRTHMDDPADTPDHTRLQELLSQHAGGPSASFTAGYVAHILADRLWRRTVLTAFRAQLPPDTASSTERSLYYQDTDQVDFNLYRRSAWRPMVWELLGTATAPEYHPLLSADEIGRWRQRTLDWFDTLKQEPGVTPQYVTDSMVANFIVQAADEVAERFTKWRATPYI
jgi:hypothetical protein